MFINLLKPQQKINWLYAFSLAFAAYLIAFLLRAHEIPSWDNPLFKLNSEYLLATHDAYHWAAGAEGFGLEPDHPFSVFLSFVSRITHQTPANAGFWLPLFMAPLVAFVTTLWAFAFGGRNFGAVAGALAAMSPVFLGRTLLGYCDTDLVTLLFVLILGLVPALWLEGVVLSPLFVILSPFKPLIKNITKTFCKVGADNDNGAAAGAGNDNGADNDNDAGKAATTQNESASKTFFSTQYNEQATLRILRPHWLILLLITGLFGNFIEAWHSLFPYIVLAYGLLVPLIILTCTQKRDKLPLMRAALVFVLPLFAGYAGAALGIILILAISKKIPRLAEISAKPLTVWVLWGVVLVCIFIFFPDLSERLLRLITSYTKHSGDVSLTAAANVPALTYPSVAQSIIEVQNISFQEILSYLYPQEILTLVAIVGFVLLLCISPSAIFHLPLILIAFSGIMLGARMAMFGSATIALGLTVPVCLFVEYFLRKKPILRKIPLQDIALIVLLLPYVSMVPRFSTGPVLNVQHAEALSNLKTITPQDATIWTWWDWGYATQYLALRESISDGARHGGAYLYFPAAVYTTSNPLLANQLIKYVAANGGPEKAFLGKSPQEATALLQNLATENMKIPLKTKQYLVVSFDMIRIGAWVSHYGNWNFIDAEGESFSISFPSNITYSFSDGIIDFASKNPDKHHFVKADSIDELTAAGLRRESYMRFNGRHFIINSLLREKIEVGDGLYDSIMVQLLFSKPGDKRFSKYFKPVFNNTYCQVFEVL